MNAVIQWSVFTRGQLHGQHDRHCLEICDRIMEEKIEHLTRDTVSQFLFLHVIEHEDRWRRTGHEMLHVVLLRVCNHTLKTIPNRHAKPFLSL